MQSYGGIWLTDPASAAAAVAQSISIKDSFGFYRLKRLSERSLNPQIDWLLERGVRVGEFFNPWSASRFGYAHVIVDEAMLGNIRALAYANNVYQSLPFTINDDYGNSLSTNLWMLPAVPLQAIDVAFNIYLLPLVDDRFYWWERTSSIDITEETTTWTDLFGEITSPQIKAVQFNALD